MNPDSRPDDIPQLAHPRINRLQGRWRRWRWQFATRSLAVLKRLLDLDEAAHARAAGRSPLFPRPGILAVQTKRIHC